MRLHRSLIEHYGGEDGIRDVNMLESAVAMAPSSFEGEFLHGDVFDMAAAYHFHLVHLILCYYIHYLQLFPDVLLKE